MKHLKTYESFQSGEYIYILTSSDRKWYAVGSPVMLHLNKMEDLNLERLTNIRRYASGGSKFRWSTLDECEDFIIKCEERARIHKLIVSYEDGMSPGEGLPLYQPEYTEEETKQNPNLIGYEDNKYIKYSDEDIKIIINDLVPMKLFIGAYEEELENDYTQL